MTLEEMIELLPPNLKVEVLHYVSYLLAQAGDRRAQPVPQDWANSLSEFKETYTALELQKKALEWRE